jgi:hypothetical protein
MNYSPPSDEWFGKSSGDPDIFSVCMALLIIGRRPDIVNQIKDTEWTKWIPYMIDNTFFFVDSANCELFTLAYQRAPETASKYLMRLMKAEDRRGQGIYCLEHLRECWPPHLSELMLKTLMNCELKISSFESLARHLIEVGAEGTDEVIIDKFRQQTYEGDGASDLLVELAVLLLNHWAEKYWLDLWEFLKNNKELSLRVLGRIDPAYRRRAGFAEQLTDFHLGDLYSLMCELWPSKDDPPWDGGALTEQHRYAELRNNAFMILVNRGTKEACTAIESLMQRFPDQKSWMAWRLKEAQANYFRRTWTPPSAVQIISLLSNSNRRYVENEEELLSVVLESLGRFQNDCKSSSPPAVGAYWNYQKVGNKRTDFRPKEEEDLSDGIARWLRNDLGPSRGIITNREVQVRREQKTDIYINAVARKPDGDSTLLTAVVEVKGCWNEELHKAMETQLVDRYLRENGLAYGLYVVGWYLCDKWNDADPRKVRAKQMSFEELSEQLLKQAGDLAARNDFVRKIEPLILDLGL